MSGQATRRQPGPQEAPIPDGRARTPDMLAVPDLTHWQEAGEPAHRTAARAMVEGGWERVRVGGMVWRRERDLEGVATGRAILQGVE